MPMAERSFLSDMMRRIAGGVRRESDYDDEHDLIEQCKILLSDHGEVSGLIRTQRIFNRLEQLQAPQKLVFFNRIAKEFGVDDEALQASINDWSAGDLDAARRLHFAAEPQSQELIRTLNRLPGATARLVRLRADLLELLREHSSLKGLNEDFKHLFSSWFNRGFLEIRRISWSTSADILEKIIAYEAVHAIKGWDDLRQRVGDPDRRLFAFFHPAMPSEPLIFVEVALTKSIPDAIAPILSSERVRVEPESANTAVFYSISNCQKGLQGISFGNFLIKQVVSELQRELPDLATFVTLSPVPGLRRWIENAQNNEDPLVTEKSRELLASMNNSDEIPSKFSTHLAALYLLFAKQTTGRAYDPVANFHLGNGAILHKINPKADLSERGLNNSWGVMVNYLYDGLHIETHHQAYVTAHEVAASSEVRNMAKIKKDYKYV